MPIPKYFLRTIRNRLIYALITIFLASTITFIMIRSMPGDVVYTLAASLAEELRIPFEEAYKIAYHSYYGIDIEKPLWRQYLEYVAGLLQGNLGRSIYFKLPVNRVIAKFLGWTLFVLSLGITISFALGVLLGLIAGFRRGGMLDAVLSTTSTVLTAIPGYILALALYMAFAVRLKLFPLRGAYSPELTPAPTLQFVIDVLWHAALPIMTYVLLTFAGWALLIRSNVGKILEEDFLKYAEARGLSRMRIVTAYIGRNSILPLVPILAIRLGHMIGGSTLIETIFGYPGMGFYLTFAMGNRDYGLIQGIFFIMTVATILGVLIVELVMPLIDPRLRREVVA